MDLKMLAELFRPFIDQVSAKTYEQAYLVGLNLLQLPEPDLSASPGDTLTLSWESDIGFAELEIGYNDYSFLFKRDSTRITDQNTLPNPVAVETIGNLISTLYKD